MEEKFNIIGFPNPNLLNRKSEFMSKCRHKDKRLLYFFNSIHVIIIRFCKILPLNKISHRTGNFFKNNHHLNGHKDIS